jgi:DNA polymerase I
MKCRFYLLDLSEGEWEKKPCVRFWGVDEHGLRVLIIATQILPYFYFLPKEENEVNSIRERLLGDKTRFGEIVNIEVVKRKSLGRDVQVLKVICSNPSTTSTYAKAVPRALGGGSSFDDLRLPVHYVSDLMLTTCGWNECNVKDVEIEGIAVDRAYVAVTAPSSVGGLSPPKLRLLAFTILTAAQRGSAKPEQDPVRAIAVATDSGTVSLFTSSAEDDAEVLNSFTRLVHEFDPDVIVGFESNRTHWRYLAERSKFLHKTLLVGRDSSEPHTSLFGHVSITGRANLDLFEVASGMPEIKVKTINNMARYLEVPRADKTTTFDEWDRYGLWVSEAGRNQLLQNTKAEAQACLAIARAAIDYPEQLSTITGLPLDQVMTAAVGYRVDSYLIRQAGGIGELVPTKNEQPFFTYRGAIVLEPETGLHENVSVLDFTSMYPSLMKKYNLSPGTLVKPDEQVPDQSVYVIPETNHRFLRQPDGFYRIVLTALIEERRRIRKDIANLSSHSTMYRVLTERERALKVITNACYGYAAWAGARWYVREVAESAAALGRQTITETIEKANSLGLKVIYGDTDSIFVSSVRAKIDELVGWVKSQLGLEIKVEREYVRVLFTEAMKRYAGLRKDGELDIVGLEAVRGDWSEIAHRVQEQVLQSILTRDSTGEAIEGVRETIRRLRRGEVPIADLTIRKTLTKPLEKYEVRAPHVEVARKLMAQGWHVMLGDKVAYVIVKGSGKLFQKAKPYNLVKPEEVDTEYYVENQVKPAAMRILERFGVKEEQLLT